MPRDFYIAGVRDEDVEKILKLKGAGVFISDLFKLAVKRFLEKPLNEVALEIFAEKIAPKLGRIEKEPETGV